MSWIDRVSFRAKLVAMLVGLVVFAVGLTATAFVIFQWRAMTDAERSKHETIARLTAENLAPALGFGDVGAVRETLSVLLREPDVVAAEVRGLDGGLLQRVGRGSVAAAPVEPLELPVALGTEQLGTLRLMVDTRPLERELQRELAWVAGIAFVVLLVAVLLAFVMQDYLCRSVIALREGMKRVREDGDLSVRIEARGQDELAELARGFNQMIERLQTHERDLERLVEDRTRRMREEFDQRRRVERNLEKVFWALDQMGEAVLLMDQAGRVEYLNPSFAAITGHAREDLDGHPDLLVRAGVLDEALESRVFDWLLVHDVWKEELRCRRADGTEYPAIVSVARLVEPDGGISRYVVSLRDMSEHEKLESQLRQVQKMEAVGVLVGGIAHDFNNLLAAISGSLELARLDVNDPARIERWLEDLEVLAGRGAETIAKLLAFARKDRVEVRVARLQRVIEDVAGLVRVGYPESVRFEAKTCGEPLLARMDVNQIEQVLLNLINNAVDACEKVSEPRIRLILERARPDAAMRARHPGLTAEALALIRVIDNGCGMSPEIREQIFEPFFTTKEVGKGTGLGLSMAYGAIERHGGFIEVDSEPGRGSEFRIYLPLTGAEGEADEPASRTTGRSGPPKGRGELILLADDEKVVRDLGRRILEHLGYRVITAADGVEAVRLFREHRQALSLAVLDLIMPRKGGAAAASKMRELAPDFPVLFVTGYDLGATAAEVTGWEHAAVLAKPYRVHELGRRIRRLLAGRS